METLRDYFDQIPALHRSLILAGGLFFFYLLEYVIPYFRFSYNKPRHAGINIFFTATTAIVNLAFAFIIVWACDTVVNKEIGLLYLFEFPLWAFILVGLLAFDFLAAWLIHYIQHKVKWMWRFHLIHHTDTYVDSTTANRHHPGESVFRFFFTTIAVVITGAPIWLVMLYQSLSALLAQFNHANINLPSAVDKAISLIIVSPNMHKVHHHFMQPYTDSNYANIFSIWDRIFGTFKTIEKKDLVYGIDTHMSANAHSGIVNLLSIPFRRYKAPSGSKFAEDKVEHLQNIKDQFV